MLFRLEDTTTPNRNNCMILALLLVSVLYTWELCYRQMIGFPLLLHHIVTFVLIQCSTASYFDTQSVLYIRYAMLLGFHATTEQISFLALFCFRLSLFPKYESTLFYLATVQAFVLKTLVTVAALVFFALNTINDEFNDESNHWDMFWLVSFVPLLLLLYAAQVYACGILYSLAKRCKKSYETMTKVVEVAENRSISVRQRKRRVLEGLRSLTQERIHESMRMLDTFENNSLHDGGLGFSTHGHHDLSRRSFHHQYGDGRLPPPPSGHLTVSEELSARRDSSMESAFSFQHELEEHHHDSRDDDHHHHQDHDSRRRSEILREAVMTCMRTTSSSAFFGPWDEELVRLDEEEEQDDEEQKD